MLARIRRSLTAKILIAIGLTVAVVIAIYTYFVIRVQNAWWQERTMAQNVLTTSLVHEYLEGAMLSGRHDDVQRFLRELKSSQEIFRGRVIDSSGRIVFSTDTEVVQTNPPSYLQFPPELFKENRILHGRRTENGQHLTVAMRPVRNQEGCGQCHPKDELFRGAIVLEKSMTLAEARVTTNGSLLIAYGAIIFLLVGLVLWLLIVRLVTQPVSGVLEEIRRVQRGDLDARAEPQGNDEVSELARGFNAMVHSLAAARHELEESHEKQIQQAGKLASIGELASGVAHEIRNPLAGIAAAVEVLAETGGGNNTKYTEIAGEIRRQIARLNSTLRNLLDFARPREPEITPCSVSDLIKPMLLLARPDAQKQQVTIVEEFAPNVPPVCADAQQVQQALLNILLNAVQAMPNGGTLTVKTDLVNWPAVTLCPLGAREEACPRGLEPGAGKAVRITVRDTGVGIPNEHLAKIFSPFFTTKHRGTGLGLSITRTIVEKHGGKIAVESEPGRGTTFHLEFGVCNECVANAMGAQAATS